MPSWEETNSGQGQFSSWAVLGLGREAGHCEYVDGSFLGQFGHLD